MTTVLQIVDGAAEEIGIKTAEENLESADYQVILNRMNDMLLEWADIGLTPEFVEVFNSTDSVNVDRNAVAAIKYALAIRCAPLFQKAVSPFLAQVASDSMSRLEASVVSIGQVAYPDSLPQGSGNECPGTFRRDRFFPSNKVENF